MKIFKIRYKCHNFKATRIGYNENNCFLSVKSLRAPTLKFLLIYQLMFQHSKFILLYLISDRFYQVDYDFIENNEIIWKIFSVGKENKHKFHLAVRDSANSYLSIKSLGLSCHKDSNSKMILLAVHLD
ncbi:hypothetical protein BpHYR1_014373 [Brachionus plicatilis]|uniref:Uncharacterized protein n=1 Tax=Brachionus plicatilis TaxID=10195 RepID=A0A3M7RLL0_BRAPC|nr:hypothetical protein BpHYR1_014373 [Brachionus plicatilis]